MAETYTYKKIQKLRRLILSEIGPISAFTVEHMKLVEMRLQTLIMAGIDDTDIEKSVPAPIKDKDKE